MGSMARNTSWEPIALFRRWFAQAKKTGIRQPEAMALATADGRGRPSVRYVLLKHVDTDGFVFYTNQVSRKGQDLAENPHAALAIHWETTGKQVRVEGRIEQVSDAEADAYWASRPRGSQLGGAASKQSYPISGRAALLAKWRALKTKFAGKPVPRPPTWTGFRILPDAIEFWEHRDDRLHDRQVFRRTRGSGGKPAWKRVVLQP